MDGESLAVFENDLAGNLYKIWNRMSSGAYFPPPVRTQQLARVRELQRICENASLTEAAHAISVADCVLLAETRALRSDLELLLAPSPLRQAG